MRVIENDYRVFKINVLLLFSFFHYYRIIFWGNSFYNLQIFRLQKKLIRIMSDLRYRDYCRNEFKNQKILSSIVSVYISFVVVVALNNIDLYHNIYHIPYINITS